MDGNINIPSAYPLPGDVRDTPYFIVGDNPFPLRSWLMKPFSRHSMDHDERVFNYRLSRARRVVENAFGILANRFQCLITTLKQQPKNVESIVLACVCLHNIMRMRYIGDQNALLDCEDDNHQLIPGAWQDEVYLVDIDHVRGGNYLCASLAPSRSNLTSRHPESSCKTADHLWLFVVRINYVTGIFDHVIIPDTT